MMGLEPATSGVPGGFEDPAYGRPPPRNCSIHPAFRALRRSDSAWLSEADFRRLLPVCCPDAARARPSAECAGRPSARLLEPVSAVEQAIRSLREWRASVDGCQSSLFDLGDEGLGLLRQWQKNSMADSSAVSMTPQKTIAPGSRLLARARVCPEAQPMLSPQNFRARPPEPQGLSALPSSSLTSLNSRREKRRSCQLGPTGRGQRFITMSSRVGGARLAKRQSTVRLPPARKPARA